MTITVSQINWLAGFLDGEGCFSFRVNQCRVQVARKDPWPLVKAQALLGGTLYRVKGSCKPGRMYWALHITGKRAVGVMMTLYALLSPRRQEKIRECLAKWQTVKPRGACNTKSHCIRGHAFTPENCYRKPGTNSRECKACIRVHQAKYAQRRKDRLTVKEI